MPLSGFQWRQREFKVGGGTIVPRGVGCGEGVPSPQFFLLFMSKWYILANSVVLNLKYVIGPNIGEIFPMTSPKPKYWRGCVPCIPGGVDASAGFGGMVDTVCQAQFSVGSTV